MGNIAFSLSTPENQAEEMGIVARSFGETSVTPLLERIAIQQQYKYTFWSLKLDGHVVGYISIYRLMPEFLDDLLTGKCTEHEMTPEQMLPFPRQEPFAIYVDVMAVDPNLLPHQRRLYAGIMATHFIQALSELQQNGYLIEELYTVTSTHEGENLARRLGFQLLKEKSLITTRIPYMLDKQGIEALKHFIS